MGSGSLSGYFLKRFKESKGGSCSPPGGFPRIRRYGRFKLFDRILLMEPKGFLLSTRRLPPRSGEGLFRVFAMNAKHLC